MSDFRHIASVLLALPLSALALGLGEPTGQMVIGQPLAIRVPLLGPDASTVVAECVRLLPANGEATDASLNAAALRIDKGAVLIASRLPLSQPLLNFRLRVGCGYQLERAYQLLPAPPGSGMPTAAPASVARSALSLASNSHTVAVSTTLRMMSRQRYPQDSRARVIFIRRVAAANPEVFDSIEAAFDQPLPAGVHLRMPDALPRQTTAAERSAPRPLVKAPILDRSRGEMGSGKGRLIIGRDVPATKTVVDLEADVERLVGIMNEQMLIQISMAERLKSLESDVAQARRAVLLQQATNQRLEADIRELRDEQKRNSYIQLVLAILLGGFAVASLLLWRGQQRRPGMVMEDFEPLRPLPKPRAAAASASPPETKTPGKLQSVFDDLDFK